MVEVMATDEFVAWYDTLSTEEALAVQHAVNHLELQGANEGLAHQAPPAESSSQLRHIRIEVAGRALSICFGLDLMRNAALVLAGRHATEAEICRSYLELVERLWAEYHHSKTNGGAN